MASSTFKLSRSAAQTQRLGVQLARELEPGDVVVLTGPMGAGKTTFVKGLAQGLGVPVNAVSSPSFVLVREYSGRIPLYHADLFRLENFPQALSVGLEEYYDAQGVTVVEWGTQIPEALPREFLEIRFEMVDPKTRRLKAVAHGALCRKIKWA